MFGNGLLTRHTLIYQCCKSIDLASSQVIHTLDDFPGKISSLTGQNGQILSRLHRFCFEIGQFLVVIGHFDG